VYNFSIGKSDTCWKTWFLKLFWTNIFYVIWYLVFKITFSNFYTRTEFFFLIFVTSQVLENTFISCKKLDKFQTRSALKIEEYL